MENINQTASTVKQYLALPYTTKLAKTELGTYCAEIVEIPNCIAEGKTQTAALESLEKCFEHYISASLKNGRTIPIPKEIESYNGKFLVRLGPHLHYRLAMKANQEKKSLNQIILDALTKYISEDDQSTIAMV